MNGNPLPLLIMIGMIIWGCVILSNKNRGAGYYVLVILFPLIGLIVAACLSKKEKQLPPSNDITNGNDMTNNFEGQDGQQNF